MRGSIVAGALACVALAVPGAAAAAKAPSYHSPGYKGTRTAPKVLPAPPPTPIALSQGGRFPQVVVDAAGTSHIVWTEDNGNDADVVRYCRIKRGGSGCDNPPATQSLGWTKDYGPGDDPSFNVSSGPKIVVVGDQLAILDYRYPTNQPKPDGSCTSCTTLLWVSDDGGNSFSGPAIVGDQDINGGAVAYGADDDPTLGTITDTVTGGTLFQPIHPGRYTSTSVRVGDQAPDEAYSGSLTTAGGTVYMADADLSDHVFVRRIAGGDGGDISQWAPPIAFQGTDPTIAGGPSGVFVLSRAVDGQPYGVRSIGAAGASAAALVSDKDSPAFGDIFQDPSGRLFAAWENRVDTAVGGVRMKTSTDGAHWSDVQQLLAPTTSAGQIDLAATSDGGGFAVLNRTGGVNSVGEIVAAAFGPKGPTGLPGLGNLPGGGDANATSGCQKISFGSVQIDTDAGCFLHGTGANARTSVTGGTLHLNGLEIVPDANVKVLIDARAHTINTTGKVSVNLRAPGVPPITLWHGELHVDISAGDGTTLFDFDTKDFASVFEGFPISGKIKVQLQGDGVVIPISLKLPPYFGGLTASAVARADEKTGLHLDSLHIAMDSAFIGPVQLKNLAIDYQRVGSVWDGGAEIIIPGPLNPDLKAHVRFENGDFKEGDIDLGLFPGVPIFTDVYWHDLRLGLQLNPLKVSGGTSVGAIPIPPRDYTVDVRADMSIQFGTPTIFKLDGSGLILGIQLATAGFTYSSDGYAFFRAGVDFGDDWLGLKADGTIYVDPPHFGGKVTAKVCVTGICPSAAGAVSDKGIAACASEKSGPGVVYHWGDSPLDIDGSLTSCYISQIVDLPPGAARRSAGAHAAQATGGRTFTVGPNESGETLKVIGTGGAPQVTLVDPSGQAIAPAPVSDAGAPVIAASDPNQPLTLVGLRNPKAGTWTIQAAAGSPPIASVGQGKALAPPAVSVKLGGKGRTRTLHYKVSGAAGTSVTFSEVARAGEHVIGVNKAGEGTLRFTPSGGPGGRRPIVADIAVDGVGFARRTLTSYVAPPPARAAKPRNVRIRRKGSTVTVSFGRATGAARYAVTLTASDHTKRLVIAGPRQRSVRFTYVHPGTTLRARVQGISADGHRGAAGTATKKP